MSARHVLPALALAGALALAPAAAGKGPTGETAVAAGPGGDAAVAWSRSDGRVAVTRVALLGDARPPVSVPAAPEEDRPAVALDGRGRAWWAWVGQEDGASRVLVGHRGGPPRTLAGGPGAWRTHPALALGPGGAGVVAWLAQAPRAGRLVAAALPGGRRVALGPGDFAGPPAVAVDARGRGLVAWSARGAMRVAEVGRGRARAHRLGAAEPEAPPPALATGPGGRAAVAWIGPGGLMVAERGPGARWGAPLRVAADGREGRLAYAPDGSLVAAYTAGDLLAAHVMVARRGPGAGWGAPVPASSPGEPACRPDLALGARALAWTVAAEGFVCDETGLGLAGRSGIAAAALSAGVPGPPRTVAPANARNDEPRAVAGPGGRLRVVWSRVPPGAADLAATVVRVAALPARGPAGAARDLDPAGDVFPPPLAARDLRVIGGRWTARVDVDGAASSFARLERLGPGGAWRAAGRPRQTGRGGPVVGYDLGALASGAYRLTVSARDAHGNAAAMTRTFRTRLAGLAVTADAAGATAAFTMPDAAPVVARLRDPSGRVLRVLLAGRLGPGRHRVRVGAVPDAGARLELRAGGPADLPTFAWAPVTPPG